MKVLACDDEAHVGATLRAALPSDEVEFTTLATQCLASWRTLAPDVVILDRVMPGMGGMEVAARMRAEGYDGPILLFSAFTGPDLVSDAERLSVVPVPKTDIEGLVDLIDAHRLASAPATADDRNTTPA